MKIPCLVLLLSILFFTFAFLPLPLQSISTVQNTTKSNRVDYIYRSCNRTEDPKLCYKTLSRYARVVQSDPARLARVAVSVSHSHVRGAAAYLSSISITREADLGDATATPIEDCTYFLKDAAEEISDSLGQMREMGPPEAPGFKLKVSNVETWMSGAMTYQETCKDELQEEEEDVTYAAGVKKKKKKKKKTKTKTKDVFDRVDRVQKITSNALQFVSVYFDSLVTPSP